MIDAHNNLLVLGKNGRVCVMHLLTGRMLTPEEALNLAAWLVKMATAVGRVTEADFEQLLKEVRNR